MSARRVFAGSAIALLMPASLLMITESVSATDAADTTATSSVRKAAKQRISVETLPQIVQQGKKTANADSAKGAVVATIKPVKVGRKVVLQQLSGSSWKTAGTAKQDRAGRAEFAAQVSTGGLPVTYRVQAAKFKGLASLTSDEVDTSEWLVPTYTDEFSGSSLTSSWNMRGQDYEAKSKRKCSKGDPKAVKVSGGAVRLSALKDKSHKGLCKASQKGKKASKFAYRLNGHIGTKDAFAFKYGVAAARVKTHKLRGQHSSFWLQPVTENKPGSDGHEIDVIEYFGDKHPQGGLTSFIHWYKGKRLIKTGSWIKDSNSFLKNKGDGWSKNYHVFSVQWTPKVIIFRIDGKETWRTSARVSKTEQYLILSLLSSDYELAEMKDKQLPQHMYVDWVRVWETPPAT